VPSCRLPDLLIAPKVVFSPDRRLFDDAREAIIDWMAYNVGGAGENRVRDGRWLLLPSTDLACTGAVAAAGRKRHSTPFGSGS
jgi:hypothetical protein